MQSIPSGAFFKTYEAQLRVNAIQRAMEKLRAAQVKAYENNEGLFIVVPDGTKAWETGRNAQNGFRRYEIVTPQASLPVDFELPDTLDLKLVQL